MRWYFIALWVLLGATVAGLAIWLGIKYGKKDNSTDDTDASTKKLHVQFSRMSSHETSNARTIGGTLERKDMKLHSLQYHLNSIQLAENLTITGTGWKNPVNSLILYERPGVSQTAYEAYGYSEALLDTQNYVDLMDSSAVKAKLGSSVSLEAIDQNVEYRYLMVNWFQPVKFQAEARIRQDDGTYKASLWTTTGTGHKEVCDSNEYCSWVTTTPSLQPSSQTSGLAVVRHNNGGSLVRLSVPIKYSDLKASVHTLHLIFDPYQSLRARSTATPATSLDPNKVLQEQTADGTITGRYFDIGMINMTPVLVPEGSSVKREQYRVTLSGASWDLLVQFYTVDDEVRAADMGTLVKSSEVDLPDDAPGGFSVYYVNQKADQTWSLSGANEDDPMVRGITRGQDGTCTVGCMLGFCGSTNVTTVSKGDTTAQYTLLTEPTALTL